MALSALFVRGGNRHAVLQAMYLLPYNYQTSCVTIPVTPYSLLAPSVCICDFLRSAITEFLLVSKALSVSLRNVILRFRTGVPEKFHTKMYNFCIVVKMHFVDLLINANITWSIICIHIEETFLERNIKRAYVPLLLFGFL